MWCNTHALPLYLICFQANFLYLPQAHTFLQNDSESDLEKALLKFVLSSYPIQSFPIQKSVSVCDGGDGVFSTATTIKIIDTTDTHRHAKFSFL